MLEGTWNADAGGRLLLKTRNIPDALLQGAYHIVDKESGLSRNDTEFDGVLCFVVGLVLSGGYLCTLEVGPMQSVQVRQTAEPRHPCGSS